jgi:hypothetical protein
MLPEEYKLRCDKHNLKPYEYCEMCWLRNEVFESVEKARKACQSLVSDTHLAINVLNDCYFKLEKRIDSIMEIMDRIK